MTTSPNKQTVIFVGGAPRSGTTVTHQLLCTSERSNRYFPEISYIRPMINSYVVGINNWGVHTHSFFANRERFKLHVRGLVEQALDHVSRAYQSPEVLCVKDPILTPMFPWVNALMGEQVKFVTVVRNPYNVVRSRQEVIERMDKPFDAEAAAATAREYMHTYAHLDNPNMADSLFYLRYEDLTSPEVLDRLRAFTGCDDISPDRIATKEPGSHSEEAKKNPWFSPKYHAAIDTKSRLGDLDPAYCKIVDEICKPMMDRFGYAQQG